MPKSTIFVLCGCAQRSCFTSGVSMEKRVLSKFPRRRGPREGRSMEGSIGPRAMGWFQ